MRMRAVSKLAYTALSSVDPAELKRRRARLLAEQREVLRVRRADASAPTTSMSPRSMSPPCQRSAMMVEVSAGSNATPSSDST